MNKIFLIILILFLNNCSKPNTVFICGDHKCINKEEAKQYFEENLSIEVKIINIKDKEEINLVELNLRENKIGNKKISVSPKKKTKENIKILSNKEIIKIKEEIKKKKTKKRLVKKSNDKNKNKKKVSSNKKIIQKKNIIKRNDSKSLYVNKKNDIIDVCTILEKCNIDEISKFLIKQGNKRDFPDITSRQ